MTLINRQTGEVELDGTGIRIILTAEAWAQAEAGTNRGIMELSERAASSRLTMTELVHLLVAGHEGWRRRTKASGQPLNPTKALKAIESTGGFMKALVQVTESMRYSQALGIEADDEEAAEDSEEDPTTGSGSSEDASLPASLRAMPGI